MKDKKIRTQQEKKERVQRWIFNFVNFTMWASVILIGILIYFAPSAYDEARPWLRIKADYTLMFLESILGVICMNLPGKIEKELHVKIPSDMLIPFVIFLYCAIFLGEVRSYYYNVPNWDKLLHFCSAGMLGSLGFSIISILNSSKKVPIQLSPMFIAIFAFCFAVTCGAIWEIYEYTFDGIFNLNMQKFMLEDGTQLVGRAALADTMNDIITDVIGAGVTAIFGYYEMKKSSMKWIQSRQLHVEDPAPVQKTKTEPAKQPAQTVSQPDTKETK